MVSGEEREEEPAEALQKLISNSPIAALKQRQGKRETTIKMGNPKMAEVSGCLKRNALTICTVAGVIAGVVLGLILRGSKDEPWSPREIMYVSYVGDLFLRMLKSLILPLIISSLISAVGSLDMSLSGRIGARAVAYYTVTTVVAVLLGIVLVTSIHPGQGDASKISRHGTSRNVTTADTLMDLVRNLFPPNLVQAAVEQYRTVLTYPGDRETNVTNSTEESVIMATVAATVAENASNVLPPKPTNESSGQDGGKDDLYAWEIGGEFVSGTNILGLVFFSTLLGITLGKMGPRGKPLLDFFTSLSEAMMIITNWVVWMSPMGVLFLIAGQILGMKSFSVVVGQLGMYFITVLVGLFLHGFVVLPALYGIITRQLPFRFVANMTQALTTAFGTASSSATLPITIGLLEEKNKVDSRVARFVLPIGATINMDGTALYEAVAALFIAQVRNVPLGVGQVIAVSITATAASIGAAGIPQAGLVTMVMVLDTVGLPAEDVTLIFTVDWLLDRFRTAINVLGDSLGAGLVYHLSKGELEDLPDPEKGDLVNGKVSNPEKPNPSDEELEYQTTSM